MKGKILLIGLTVLTLAFFLTISYTLSFTLYESAIIMEAWAEESDYRLGESQEKGQWYAQMQEDPNEEGDETYNPYIETEEEDVFRYMPYDLDPETEQYQGDDEAEEEDEEDSSMDTESRR